jgi:hypothetical protein
MKDLKQTIYILSQKLINHGLSSSERALLQSLWTARVAELTA